MSRSIAALSALFIVTSPALSQSQSHSTAEEILRQLVSRHAEQAKEQAINQLFSMAPSGEFTRDMAETIDQRFEAQIRVGAITAILLNDLDGNGEVSQGEIDRIRAILLGRERSQFERMILQVDVNKDGALSAAEIAQRGEAAVADQRGQGTRRGLQGTDFMVFDADGDGVVVVEDILKTIDRVAAEGPPTARAVRPQPADRCDLPEPSAEAVPVYVGGYEGTAVSTVAVAGLDNPTSFATFVIEEGDDPLYIVLNVYDAMVVRVTGATERVERFVGGSSYGLGVVGLPEEVVDLTSMAHCRIPLAYRAETSDRIRANALLSAKLRRAVRMVGSYELGQMELPSGHSEAPTGAQQAAGGLVVQRGSRRFQVTEDGMEEIAPLTTLAGLEATLLRFYPGGIESVMPEDVVTNGTAQAYDVLPQQAGLIQLVQDGALSVLDDGTFSIDKPIARFPAGLAGAHSVRFVLRRGVPMPSGSPGHSSVLIEETGE